LQFEDDNGAIRSHKDIRSKNNKTFKMQIDDRQRFGCAKVLLCQTGNQKPYIDEKQKMFADVKVIIRSRKSEDRKLLFDDAKVVIRSRKSKDKKSLEMAKM
jgi:hypothetical protein